MYSKPINKRSPGNHLCLGYIHAALAYFFREMHTFDFSATSLGKEMYEGFIDVFVVFHRSRQTEQLKAMRIVLTYDAEILKGLLNKFGQFILKEIYL
jgi:hypothetical protein